MSKISKSQKNVSLNTKISMIFNGAYIFGLAILVFSYMYCSMAHMDNLRNYIVRYRNDTVTGVIVDVYKTGWQAGNPGNGEPVMKYHYRYKNNNGETIDGYQYGLIDFKNGQNVEVLYSPLINRLSAIKDIIEASEDEVFWLVSCFTLFAIYLVINSILNGVFFWRLLANGKIAYGRAISITEIVGRSIEESSEYKTVVIEYTVSDNVYTVKDRLVPKNLNEYPIMYLPERPSKSHLLQTMFWNPMINNDGDIVLKYNSKEIVCIGIILHVLFVIVLLLTFIIL